MRNSSSCNVWWAAMAAVCLAGCGSASRQEDPVALQGLDVTMDLGASAGVDAVQLDLVQVSCGDGAPMSESTPLSFIRSLSDIRLHAITETGSGPADRASDSHLLAREFIAMGAGCYDLTTTPIAQVIRCDPAQQLKVEVREGLTTAVRLINQCHGSDPRSLVGRRIPYPPIR